MGPGEGVGSWGRQGDEAEGLQWPPWAELLCLGVFQSPSRVLRSEARGRAAMEGKQRLKLEFRL